MLLRKSSVMVLNDGFAHGLVLSILKTPDSYVNIVKNLILTIGGH